MPIEEQIGAMQMAAKQQEYLRFCSGPPATEAPQFLAEKDKLLPAGQRTVAAKDHTLPDKNNELS